MCVGSGKEVLLPAPPPLRTGRAPFDASGSSMEQRTVKHAVNRLGLAATCTVRGPSRLPKCLGGGGRTSEGHYGPADSSAWPPNAGWRSSPVRPHQGEVGSLSGGVMSPRGSTPVRPITGRRPLAPPSFTRCPVRSSYGFPSGGVRHRGGNGLTTFRGCNPGGLGRACTPVVQRLRRGSSEPPDLTTCLLAQACQHLWLVLDDGACGASPPLTVPPILVPDRLGAGSRRVGARSHGHPAG
jgi:hypothetical protein